MNELAQPFADLAEQLEFVTAERDRLRDAVEILRTEMLEYEAREKFDRTALRDAANWRAEREAEVERLREDNELWRRKTAEYYDELEFVRSERDRLRDAVEVLRVELEKR